LLVAQISATYVCSYGLLTYKWFLKLHFLLWQLSMYC